jgi:His/Glu/Gln/Arg/opine family amino acid ABC transporter permease subunit
MDALIQLLRDFGPAFLSSTWVTWRLTVLAFTLAFLGGFALTVLRLLPVKPLKLAVSFYIEVFRNIPGVVLLVMIVFALPYLNVVIDYEPSVVLALALIGSAFAADNLRSGINTVEVGQVEAAYSLGLSLTQTLFTVVLPQALRAVVQPMTSLLIGLMLSTALASQVPVSERELTSLVDKINADTASGILTFGIAAVIYVGSGLLISGVGAWLDNKARVLR